VAIYTPLYSGIKEEWSEFWEKKSGVKVKQEWSVTKKKWSGSELRVECKLPLHSILE